MPAAALVDPAQQRRHRAERYQIAGGVVERLAGQGLEPRFSGGFGLGKVQPGRGLRQAVEAAALGPWSGVAVG